MTQQVDNDITADLHGDVVPWHSGLKILVQVSLPEHSGLVNIFQPVVVELLAIPVPVLSLLHQPMLMRIPPAIANIQPAHEPNLLINHN